jgi:hypothetical protein
MPAMTGVIGIRFGVGSDFREGEEEWEVNSSKSQRV